MIKLIKWWYMAYFNIDAAMFIGFLLINLIIGLGYGKDVKTIKDYALGGRNFSTGSLVCTIVATWVTGSSFFIILSKTYSDGLSFVIAICGMAFSLAITAFFLIPRMAEFMGSLSTAEVMGNLYGKHVRLITAVCGILWIVGSLAVQFKVFGNVFNYFLGIESSNAIILASVIVIIYSAFGGIRAVTYTDVLQFFTFGFVIPAVGIIIWNHFHSLDLSVAGAFKNPQFDLKEIFSLKNPKLTSLIFLIIYFSIPSMSPVDFQRISMARNVKQARTAYFISAVLIAFVMLAMAWIPFLIVNINPNLEPGNITGYIINNYTYTGLKGLVIIGVAAMAMSSADSFINGSSVLFGHDLKECLNIKVNNLLLSRIFAICLGGFAIYLALSTDDLLSMVRSAASFYMPVVSIPMFFSVLGFRSTTKSVLISMVAGFSTVILWNFFELAEDVIVPAMLVNLIFLMGSHYLLRQKGGWVGIKDNAYLESIRSERKRNTYNIINVIKNFNFITFCKKTAPTNELTYTGLGIYFIFYTFSTIYSTQVELSKENGKIILWIYQIMMCTGTVIAMYPIWPLSIKKEIRETFVQISWNIAIFYMLIFFSCFFVMLSDFGHLQFVTFTVNMIIVAILVGWKLGFAMIITGFYLAVQFYKYYVGIEVIDISIGSSQSIFMYALILSGAAFIVFIRPKEVIYALTEKRNEHLKDMINDREYELENALNIKHQFIRNMEHEFRTPMTGVTSMAQTLMEGYDNLTDAQRRQATEVIFKSSVRISKFEETLLALSKLENESYKLRLEEIDLSNLLRNRIALCKKLYATSDLDDRFILDHIENGVIALCDEYYIGQTFDNLIINSMTYAPKGNIIISLKKLQGEIEFTISDEGIGIPEHELYDVFKPFTVSSRTETPSGGRGCGLALCEKVIKLHKGMITAKNNTEKGVTFKMILRYTS